MTHCEIGKTYRGYGVKGLLIPGAKGCDVFSVSMKEDEVTILEECDGFYHRTCSKAEAIEIFEEIIEWLKNQPEEINGSE